MKNTRGVLSIFSETAICANCAHFHQHYGYHFGEYLPLHAGHCAYSNIKDRFCVETCEHFMSGEQAAYAKEREKQREEQEYKEWKRLRDEQRNPAAES